MKKSIIFGVSFFVIMLIFELVFGETFDSRVIFKVTASALLSSTLFFFLVRKKNK
ncbi:MAG: hypothetical protein SNJ71_07330 [Bacteroidales bacterium]